MVKHIVLFKLKDEVPAEEKLEVMTKFKEAIDFCNSQSGGRIEYESW